MHAKKHLLTLLRSSFRIKATLLQLHSCAVYGDVVVVLGDLLISSLTTIQMKLLATFIERH